MLFWQLNIIRMDRQFEYFKEYQQRVRALIGSERTKRLVNQALILITVGGNDFVNNYYLVPFSARSRQFSLPDYVKYLISEYRKILLVKLLSFFGNLSSASFPTFGLLCFHCTTTSRILDHFNIRILFYYL
jgi:hypothetical protein